MTTEYPTYIRSLELIDPFGELPSLPYTRHKWLCLGWGVENLLPGETKILLGREVLNTYRDGEKCIYYSLNIVSKDETGQVSFATEAGVGTRAFLRAIGIIDKLEIAPSAEPSE